MATTATFQTSAANASPSSSYTFTAQPIGTAAANRYVFVCIAWLTQGSLGQGISSVTIGGISASIADDPGTVSGDSSAASSIWYALVPTGTTADVVVNYSSAPYRCGIGVWSVTGLVSITSALRASGTSNPLSVSINVDAGGSVIGVSSMVYLAAAGTYTWAGITKDYDGTISGAATQTGAHANFAVAQTALTVSTTYTQTPSSGMLNVIALSPNTVVPITGVFGSGTLGTLSGSVADTVSGVSGTGQVGSLIANPGAVVSGVSASGQTGSLTTFGFSGVFASGQVGSLLPTGSAFILGVSGTGAIGSVSAEYGAIVVGVSATGIASDVFPIPPAPATRAPLLIPAQNGLPASLWLGSTNGN